MPEPTRSRYVTYRNQTYYVWVDEESFLVDASGDTLLGIEIAGQYLDFEGEIYTVSELQRLLDIDLIGNPPLTVDPAPPRPGVFVDITPVSAFPNSITVDFNVPEGGPMPQARENTSVAQEEARDTIALYTRHRGVGLTATQWDALEEAYRVIGINPPPRRDVVEYPSTEHVKLYYALH